MPPIPVYTHSPINAAVNPTGVTPQTADGSDQSKSQPPSQSATTTASAASAYTPARPGAATSVPAPSGAAQISQYAPIQPTPTQPLSHSNNPPPPQPGAVPVPNGSAGRPGQPAVPPPPKAGEKYNLPVTTPAPQASTVPYPPQMSVPAPTMPYPAQQRATSTSTGQAAGHTGQGNPGDFATNQNLGHPPGYHQNTNASEFTRDQRAAHNGLLAEDKPEEGVWDSAKKWAQAAGDKLAEAEDHVWRRVSKGS